MTIIKTTALITINETLWVQMLLFLVFLFVINRVMFRPVRRNMAERQRHFDALRDEIRGLRSRLGDLVGQAEQEDLRVRAEARRMRHALRSEGEAEAQAVVDRTRADIEKMRMETEDDLKATLVEARKGLEAERGVLADAIVASLLEREAGR